ncbi:MULTISPECIES: tRNA 2-thiouridine-synthesizing protein [Corynebacterium]|uniref:tRNA 2-thiouridine-synthesizing protein n=1 Tax=Corynebacterium TaxID=1716 RepID=UPI0029343E6C|nr:tRNA 2-thiouridine-synthesizing protein [Corynebacterium sp. CTNIH16]MDV2427272.1 tRNA 2-thiouridine-synthesizing protein [Corynebacterium sp. CTNIH16]
MNQRQISNVADQVEQGILGLEGVDRLLAYLDSLHPDELAGVDFLVDRMFEEERNQIWEITESLKEFLTDLKEYQK